MGAALGIQKELTGIPDFNTASNGAFLSYEARILSGLKKATLMVTGYAAQKYMQALAEEQEILSAIADMIMYVYAAESTHLRIAKLADKHDEATIALQTDMYRTYLHDCADRIAAAGRTAVHAMAQGDELRMMLLGLKRFTKTEPFNSIAARRRIADALISAGRYCF
jgi:alkylation response protein AidB-like acyl-CoA dehydrogenase